MWLWFAALLLVLVVSAAELSGLQLNCGAQLRWLLAALHNERSDRGGGREDTAFRMLN
jgi:hypothetical protein